MEPKRDVPRFEYPDRLLFHVCGFLLKQKYPLKGHAIDRLLKNWLKQLLLPQCGRDASSNSSSKYWAATLGIFLCLPRHLSEAWALKSVPDVCHACAKHMGHSHDYAGKLRAHVSRQRVAEWWVRPLSTAARLTDWLVQGTRTLPPPVCELILPQDWLLCDRWGSRRFFALSIIKRVIPRRWRFLCNIYACVSYGAQGRDRSLTQITAAVVSGPKEIFDVCLWRNLNAGGVDRIGYWRW